jgi:predicted PurR-regulated permease PerM
MSTVTTNDADQVRVFAKKLALVLLLVFLWFIRDIAVLLLISGVLAAGIAPVVHRTRALMRLWLGKRIARSTAVLLVYLPFFILAAVILFLGLPYLFEESRKLMIELPRLLNERIFIPLEKYIPMDGFRAMLPGGEPAPGAEPVITYVKGAATVVGSSIAVLFIVFYMLIDAERLKNLILLAFPSSDRSSRKALLRRMGRRMSAWLSAQLILAGVIGLATFIALTALRIPYAVPLALIAAIGEMIPVVGPIVGAVPALAVAMLQSPWQFWTMLVVAVLIQQIENLVLVPRLMGDKLHVSPLAIFIAFMIGASLLGIIGAILAAPMAAVIQLVFEEVYVARRERRQDTSRAGALVTSETRENEEA